MLRQLLYPSQYLKEEKIQKIHLELVGRVSWHNMTSRLCMFHLFSTHGEKVRHRLEQYFAALDLTATLHSKYEEIAALCGESSEYRDAILASVLNCVKEVEKNTDLAWHRYCEVSTQQKLLPAPTPKHVFLGGAEIRYAVLQQVNSEDPDLIKSYIESEILNFKY